MTTFAESVLDDAQATKPGEWTTYGDIAKRCGSPGAARAVGVILFTANGTQEDPKKCVNPAWRIRKADGTMSITPSHWPNKMDRTRIANKCDLIWVKEGGRLIHGLPDPAQRRAV
jgi:alkylated DNA nucleotide flippase Atl1